MNVSILTCADKLLLDMQVRSFTDYFTKLMFQIETLFVRRLSCKFAIILCIQALPIDIEGVCKIGIDVLISFCVLIFVVFMPSSSLSSAQGARAGMPKWVVAISGDPWNSLVASSSPHSAKPSGEATL